jgi:hypothetical protein
MTQAAAGNDDRASIVLAKALMKDYIARVCTLVTDNYTIICISLTI